MGKAVYYLLDSNSIQAEKLLMKLPYSLGRIQGNRQLQYIQYVQRRVAQKLGVKY